MVQVLQTMGEAVFQPCSALITFFCSFEAQHGLRCLSGAFYSVTTFLFSFFLITLRRRPFDSCNLTKKEALWILREYVNLPASGVSRHGLALALRVCDTCPDRMVSFKHILIAAWLDPQLTCNGLSLLVLFISAALYWNGCYVTWYLWSTLSEAK